MSDTKNNRIARCFQTLADAMDDAGGAPPFKDIFAMTVLDFIMKIAGPNGIQFHYKEPTERITSESNH